MTDTITQVCWTVAAVDDLIFENSEIFTLTVVPITAGVSVGQQSTATVTIIDNDGETSLYTCIVGGIMIVLVQMSQLQRLKVRGQSLKERW